MERTEALEIVQSLAAEVLEADATTMSETTRFREDLQADSLALLELVMGMEDQFAIRVPEEELAGVDTIGDAVDLVLSKLT